jgi:hypothetical protein
MDREQRAQREMFFNRGNEPMAGEMDDRPSATIGLQDMRRVGRNFNPMTIKETPYNTQRSDRMPTADVGVSSGGAGGFTGGRGSIFYENAYDTGKTPKTTNAQDVGDAYQQPGLASAQTQSRPMMKRGGNTATTRLGAPAGAEPVFGPSELGTKSRRTTTRE